MLERSRISRDFSLLTKQFFRANAAFVTDHQARTTALGKRAVFR
jgi:hypothetical protein